ncbi:MAG: hypothetical protein FJW68_06535 [Actinobacteria bacterium]|nr:hypothetical protein [Actinomycetota bacterium]
MNNLKPEMILARPVMNAKGTVLLNENTELTETIIEKLRAMNAGFIYIKGDLKPAVSREEALADIDKRFLLNHNQLHAGKLKRILIEHIESLYE